MIKFLKVNKVFHSLKEGFAYSIFSFFNQGMSFILLILLAKYILPKEYGQLSIFNTFVTFLGFIVAFQTQGYESISFFKKDINGYRCDFSVVTYITLAGTALLCVLFLLFSNILYKTLGLTLSFLYLGIGISVATIFINRLLDYYRVNRRIKKYGIFSSSFAIFNFVFSLLFVIRFQLNWEGRLYAQLLCSILFSVFAIYIFLKNKLITINVNTDSFKFAILWGLPIIPHTAATWLRQGLDRIIVNANYSLYDVGIFSFALNMMSMIVIFGIAFNSSNSVSIYQLLSSTLEPNEKFKQFKEKKNNFLFIYIVGSIVITMAGCAILLIFLPKYIESVPYFIILSIAGLLQCLYFLYCNLIFYYEENKSIMYITFFSSIFHLSLSLFLTKYSLYFTAGLHVFTQLIIFLLVKRIGLKVFFKNENYECN